MLLYIHVPELTMNPSAATYTPRFLVPRREQTAAPVSASLGEAVPSDEHGAAERERPRTPIASYASRLAKRRVVLRYSRQELLQVELEVLTHVSREAAKMTSLCHTPLPMSFVQLAQQLPSAVVDEVLDIPRAAALVHVAGQGRRHNRKSDACLVRAHHDNTTSPSPSSRVHHDAREPGNGSLSSSPAVMDSDTRSGLVSSRVPGRLSQSAGQPQRRVPSTSAGTSPNLDQARTTRLSRHVLPLPGHTPTECSKAAATAPAQSREEATPHPDETVLSCAAKETSLAIIRALTSPLYLPCSAADSSAASSSQSSSHDIAAEAMRDYHCVHCASARVHREPCPAVSMLMQQVHRLVLRSKYGACLMQTGEVVWGLLQLALVFEVKQSSLRMRRLAERCPAAVRVVAEYLCGDGYHMPLPAVTDHEAWSGLSQLLCFDAIRDNRTRIKTDLSKHWRRRRTPFEQFVFFFTHRDDRPRVQVRNIITRSVKPGMVAMLSGDVVAMVLLSRLGFFVPPDKYWRVYPFLKQSLGEDTLLYSVVRHLARYLSCTQDPNMYDPIGEPFV